MNTITKDELFGHVREFLNAKGVELQDGSYTRRIEKGCDLLAKTINGGREVLTRAKSEADRRLDQVRQVIHEKTAPRKPPEPAPTPAAPPAAPKSETARTSPSAPGKTKPVRRQRAPRATKVGKKQK